MGFSNEEREAWEYYNVPSVKIADENGTVVLEVTQAEFDEFGITEPGYSILEG